MERPGADTALGSKLSAAGSATTARGLDEDLHLEQQSSPLAANLLASARPPALPTAGQSGVYPEWAQPDKSHHGSRSTLSAEAGEVDIVPTDFWPLPDSDDDSEEASGSKTAKPGKAARKIKAILQKFDRQYNQRYQFLPNDTKEKDRNALQHEILLKTLDGKLHLAPVQNPRQVLDLGCGPGDWPLEFARRHPHATILGVDIDQIQPPWHLPNCRFQVADFTEKWSYDVKFDLIHLRHLGDLPSRDVMASIYENLQPGGWAEFTEWIVSVQATHNSFTETSFYRWLSYWRRGLSMVGKTVYYPLQYKQLLLDAGFKNVTERKYALPVNPWPPSKKLQELGQMMAMNINNIIEPMSMPIFTEVLRWPPEEVRDLLAEVRQDIADVGIHSFMTLLTVYGQKPRRDEYSTASSVTSPAAFV
ncbi:S-adenosyl-L-methionine-dependent methyltransferase [Xylariaceae sp. FL0594]|nr:S-adenosyl-L-methionine-dependent methyltransferase [Xylariaceae sp. FL0594]